MLGEIHKLQAFLKVIEMNYNKLGVYIRDFRKIPFNELKKLHNGDYPNMEYETALIEVLSEKYEMIYG